MTNKQCTQVGFLHLLPFMKENTLLGIGNSWSSYEPDPLVHVRGASRPTQLMTLSSFLSLCLVFVLNASWHWIGLTVSQSSSLRRSGKFPRGYKKPDPVCCKHQDEYLSGNTQVLEKSELKTSDTALCKVLANHVQGCGFNLQHHQMNKQKIGLNEILKRDGEREKS